jgi:polysaccharide deacetylase 2 family uncharacterized protein YibQ
MGLAIDTQMHASIRIAPHRGGAALGIAHLHQDSTKLLKDDFMSPLRP